MVPATGPSARAALILLASSLASCAGQGSETSGAQPRPSQVGTPTATAPASLGAMAPAPPPARSLELQKLGFPVLTSRVFRSSVLAFADTGLDAEVVVRDLAKVASDAGYPNGPAAIDDSRPAAPVLLLEVRAPSRRVRSEGAYSPLLDVMLFTTLEGDAIGQAARLARMHLVLLAEAPDPAARFAQIEARLTAAGAPGDVPVVVLVDPSSPWRSPGEARPMLVTTNDPRGLREALDRMFTWLETAR